MKSVTKLLLAVALGVTTLTACPGDNGGGTPGATINSFKAKVANTTDAPAEVLNLSPNGGTAEFSWSVTNATSIEIDNGVLASTTQSTGSATKGVTATTTFTLIAKKTGTPDAKKTVTVNVQAGQTINVKVLKFNGEVAVGVRVQVGDANTQNNQQLTTNTSGIATFANVPSPYTVSAVPTTAVEVPVSFKGVTRTDPTIVLEPRTGVTGTCSNAQEGLIRFRLPQGATVDVNPANNTLGYMYFIPEGRRTTALHEDSLKSNAVQVLKPGQRSGYIRVRFSQNSCVNEARGSLLYVERSQGGYTFSGVLKNVVARPGVTTPASGDPAYQIPTANLGSKAISGQVILPGAFTKGIVFAVAEIGGGSVIVSDPRDIKNIDTSTEGRKFAFNLPGEIGGSDLKYRIGVYAEGPKHTSWFFSDNIYPLPNGGLNNLTFTTTTEFQAQSPVSNISITDPANIPLDFDWTDVAISETTQTDANLYYMQMNKQGGVNCPELDNKEVIYTAVSADKTSNQQRSQFRLPVLPTPAKLSAGSPALSCKYEWLASNGVIIRQASNSAPTADAADASVDSDKLLDGRLTLKRHYIRTAGNTSLLESFYATIPVWVRDVANPIESNLMFRDEIMWRVGNAPIQTALNAAINGAGEAGIPPSLDASQDNDTADVPFVASLPVTGDVTAVDRTLLNDIFTSKFVGPFNNPSEVKGGTIANETANFSIRTQN